MEIIGGLEGVHGGNSKLVFMKDKREVSSVVS